MTIEPYQFAHAWVTALTGNAEQAVFNWRFIHDQDKGKPAIKRRGTLPQIWEQACAWNAAGYGIFATVNEMDGTGYDQYGQPIQGISGDKKEHVFAVRAHVVDLDNLSAMENLQRATMHQPAPWFYVQTSPGKAHVYWPVVHYRDNDFYELQQRKLRQYYDGDKAVVDVTRVLRVPGFYHQKGAPQLVTCYALPGFGVPITGQDMAASLMHVNAPEDGGGRHKLGDPDLAAPSGEWALYGLESMPVDGMSHPDFISFTAAFKQAASTHLDPDVAKQHWLKWCEKFGVDSKGLDYNLKHWDSIQDTEVGWKSMLRQNANLNAQFMFRGSSFNPANIQAQRVQQQAMTVGTIPENNPIPETTALADLMLAEDYAEYFKDCTFVTQFGLILDSKGQMLTSTQFNGTYGGPRFVIAPTGSPTDEPWKAATRSNFWRIPTVDYLRFLPHEPPGKIIADELGRTGVNTYRPAIIKRIQGDPSPFLRHLELLLPDPGDRKILLDFIAHNAKYPGHKIPWAPLIQSVEGAGKGIFKSLFSSLVGSAYFHSPNAKELVEGGAKFNAWMRGKLFILVDEIRTDERRDMIEVLKPWISESEIEIQAKGYDQKKEDNFSNWAFFSNYKDAVPINQNSRRFAIFYSALQSIEDLQTREMTDAYFNWLYGWFKEGQGSAILANYFYNEYELERGNIPQRAPQTSSHSEAVKQGRSVNERTILDAIEAGLPGFRGGWISVTAAANLLKQKGARAHSDSMVERILEGLGYVQIGRHHGTIFQEPGIPPMLYHTNRAANVQDYMPLQNYGENAFEIPRTV